MGACIAIEVQEGVLEEDDVEVDDHHREAHQQRLGDAGEIEGRCRGDRGEKRGDAGEIAPSASRNGTPSPSPSPNQVSWSGLAFGPG